MSQGDAVLDTNDVLICAICQNDFYMAAPNYVNKFTGKKVLCCWLCRTYYDWKIAREGFVSNEEYEKMLEHERKREGTDPGSKMYIELDESFEDDEKTPLYPFGIFAPAPPKP